eukprot:4967953-Lingulodinium_polyedra.AAC.1
MFDASEEGFGVVESEMNAVDIFLVARFNERWRFKCEYTQAQGPRVSGLASAGPLEDPTAVKPMSRPGRE